ncbi:hypothetical protein P3T40_003546 [Paraburkholderia sp. EB58]|jgi:hypothetical protein|uniref:hypothetical protein n=1 Tax=Paraburkholderia sp. EB58 TaxID=3035125 RepID=UPI003D20C0DD
MGTTAKPKTTAPPIDRETARQYLDARASGLTDIKVAQACGVPTQSLVQWIKAMETSEFVRAFREKAAAEIEHGATLDYTLRYDAYASRLVLGIDAYTAARRAGVKAEDVEEFIAHADADPAFESILDAARAQRDANLTSTFTAGGYVEALLRIANNPRSRSSDVMSAANTLAALFDIKINGKSASTTAQQFRDMAKKLLGDAP